MMFDTVEQVGIIDHEQNRIAKKTRRSPNTRLHKEDSSHTRTTRRLHGGWNEVIPMIRDFHSNVPFCVHISIMKRIYTAVQFEGLNV